MGIVFDEVIATVEPPEAGAPEQEAQETSAPGGALDRKVLRVIETEQRRARRLWAD